MSSKKTGDSVKATGLFGRTGGLGMDFNSASTRIPSATDLDTVIIFTGQLPGALLETP